MPDCANCGASLVGRYCHACGQKQMEAPDRRLAHLLGQFFTALTDLDSRFWRSFRTLLLRPGQLSIDHLAGRRQRHLAPVTLFLLANLLYFVAPAITDFDLAFHDHIDGPLRVTLIEETRELSAEERARIADWQAQGHSRWTGKMLLARVAERDAMAQAHGARYTLGDYQRAYDQRRSEVARMLIILHVPVLALLLWIAHPRSGLYYAEHFIVALHLFAFMVLTIELLVLPASWIGRQLGVGTMPGWLPWLLIAGIVLYFARALQVVYRRAFWWSLPCAMLVLVGLGWFSIRVYRDIQFLLIYAMT